MSSSALRSLTVAARGKGAVHLARRIRSIGRHYGVGPGRMERRLAAILELVERHGCRPTLPITAAAVRRNPRIVASYAARGIEFALHGLHHVDHRELGAVEQIERFALARRIFDASGIEVTGFRAPYLRSNGATLHALRENGFLYDSSQAIHWPLPPEIVSDGYRRALDFYDAWAATDHASLPTIQEGIVRIPCSVPDDEAAIDRLRLSTSRAIADLWLGIFRATHERGELFTLAVHPERIGPCGAAIDEVLAAARSAPSPVWVAPLDDVATWWRARADAAVVTSERPDGWWHLDVDGPEGLVLSVGDVEVRGGGRIGDGSVRPDGGGLDVRSPVRPLIGVHPGAPPTLAAFLREHGFVVEPSRTGTGYARFLHPARFLPRDEGAMLRDLEGEPAALVRIGRWPDGAASALSVTGDVDALTIWDYASRFIGR